ncbi:hypothetical protein ACKVWC_006536 [Pyricularia oryzae]
MNSIKNAIPVVAAVGFGVWNAWYQLRDPLKEAAENKNKEALSKAQNPSKSPEKDKPATGPNST